jgi:CBS domain-containing protein
MHEVFGKPIRKERMVPLVTQQLTASDVMQRDIVTISPEDTLRQALALMTEYHVTGLPVMDEESRCIGVVAATDILDYEQDHAEESSEGETTQFFDPETQQWETVSVSAFGLEEFGDVRASEVMSRELVWVERDTPLKEVARRMIEERVHRVLVMDERSYLYGIISAYDLVRVVAGE